MNFEGAITVGRPDIDDIDYFFDPSVVQDPYPYFDALRGRGPIVRERHHGVFVITGYDEAVAIYNDAARFSSCNSATGPFPGFPVPLEGDDVSELIDRHRHELPMSRDLVTMDPPEHTKHRALLMRLITPKRLKENEEFIWRQVDRCLDEFLGRGACEFIGDFASPLATLVIADLLGVPESDHPEFRAALARREGGAAGEVGGETMAHDPFSYCYERFAQYVEDRRRHPRDDVLGGLARATFPDGSLPEVMDAVRVAAILFAAGQETTVRLLGTALQVLGEHSDLQARLRADRSLIPSFVEEALRFEGPVKAHFRLSRVAVTVGGVEIPAGSTVMFCPGAANRDPRRFEDPHSFVVDRPNARQHVAFGHGIHTCPGAPLARAEARVALERILDRMADIRVSEAHHGPPGARRYEYVPNYIFRGLRSLHLEFTPVAETAP